MIAERYLQLRNELETSLNELLKFASEMKRPPWSLETIQELLANIREPLLIVAIGEKESGKSTLLEALMAHHFSKGAIVSREDRVHVLRYGSEQRSVEQSSHLTEHYLPLAFLRDFTLVDTPGIEAMKSQHQNLIEEFLPCADLVLFVLSVINPWTQAAWDFLGSAQSGWLKNMVYVLQQTDLRTPREIDLIRRHLQDTAVQKLGFAPPIFAVSARDALLARTTGLDKERLWRESHFGLLEEQINLILTQPGERSVKLRSACQVACLILHEIASEIRASADHTGRDEAHLARMDLFVRTRRDQTLRQLSGPLRTIQKGFEDFLKGQLNFLKRQLSFWRLWNVIGSQARWQDNFVLELESKLGTTLQPPIEEAAHIVESDLRGVWPQLFDTIQTDFAPELQSRVSKTIPDFSRQRHELLQSIQRTIADCFSKRIMPEQWRKVLEETSTRLRALTIIAGTCTIAALLAAMINGTAARIIAVLAALVAIIGTVIAFRQRGKILNTYQDRMKTFGSELIQAIEDQFNCAIDLFYKDVARAFQPLVDLSENRRQSSQPFLDRTKELERRFVGVAAQLK
jgi:GTPase SAR1 family protein